MIHIGGVYTTFCQEEGILFQKYRDRMGGVSRYFSKVSGSEVNLTLLRKKRAEIATEIPVIRMAESSNH